MSRAREMSRDSPKREPVFRRCGVKIREEEIRKRNISQPRRVRSARVNVRRTLVKSHISNNSPEPARSRFARCSCATRRQLPSAVHRAREGSEEEKQGEGGGERGRLSLSSFLLSRHYRVRPRERRDTRRVLAYCSRGQNARIIARAAQSDAPHNRVVNRYPDKVPRAQPPFRKHKPIRNGLSAPFRSRARIAEHPVQYRNALRATREGGRGAREKQRSELVLQ